MKQRLFLFFLFLFNRLVAQNIVPNGSFEDPNICTELSKPCCPAAWFFIQNNATGYSIYDNMPSAEGYRSLKIEVLNKEKNTRQYWQTKLLCPLQPNKNYIVSISIACTSIDPNVNDIGFYFTDKFIFFERDTSLQLEQYFNFTKAKVKNIKNGWLQLTSQFIGTDSSQYLVIGNFAKASNKEIYDARQLKHKSISLLVDDIMVTPIDKIICTNYTANKDSIYAKRERHSFKEENKITMPVLLTKKIDSFFINNIQLTNNNTRLADTSILNELKRTLKTNAIREIEIIGYTNKSHYDASDKEMSLKTATAIAKALQDQLCIANAKIKMIGKGATAKIPTKLRTRRVAIYVHY
jgi:outer membrane protein OmpA-like peptidoglycan-associated protein